MPGGLFLSEGSPDEEQVRGRRKAVLRTPHPPTPIHKRCADTRSY